MPTGTELLNTIAYTLNKNSNLIIKLSEIMKEMETEITSKINKNIMIDLEFIKQSYEECKMIEKKIKDNVATINSLSSRVVLDDEYYESQLKSFSKSAYFVSSTFPDSIATNSTLIADVVFRNMGIFFSWTQDRNVKLNVNITDSDNISIVTDNFSLDVQVNLPGDESLNEDYQIEKTFSVSLDIPEVSQGIYNVIFTISDNSDEYDYSYKSSIEITLV